MPVGCGDSFPSPEEKPPSRSSHFPRSYVCRSIRQENSGLSFHACAAVKIRRSALPHNPAFSFLASDMALKILSAYFTSEELREGAAPLNWRVLVEQQISPGVETHTYASNRPYLSIRSRSHSICARPDKIQPDVPPRLLPALPPGRRMVQFWCIGGKIPDEVRSPSTGAVMVSPSFFRYVIGGHSGRGRGVQRACVQRRCCGKAKRKSGVLLHDRNLLRVLYPPAEFDRKHEHLSSLYFTLPGRPRKEIFLGEKVYNVRKRVHE